jgi:3'-phosphoadenosine 5'-phosphosulfate sulfotransferase (PAPS reductase)/FAD synthetase
MTDDETACPSAAERNCLKCPCGRTAPCADAPSTPTPGSPGPQPASPGSSPATGPQIPDRTEPETESWGDLEEDEPETDSPDEILQRADTHDWDNVYALCSGGQDSTAALHYTYHNAPFSLDGIIFIDTNIGLLEVKEYVQDLGEEFSLPVHIADTRREEDEITNRICSYGFGGASNQSHRFEWICNKDKPLQNLLQQFSGKTLLISGATREESQSRYEKVAADGIEQKGNHLYASPLARWTPRDVREYHEENSIPQSDAVMHLESSGDCLCGCFADRFLELNQLRDHYRYMFTYIQSLEARVMDAARTGQMKREKYENYVLWGHGSMGAQEFDIKLKGDDQAMLSTCIDNCEPAIQTSTEDGVYQTLTEAAYHSDLYDLPETPTAYRDRFDVAQAIPDDCEVSELEMLRRGYEALNDVASQLGYDDIDEMVADRYNERQVAREYINDHYPEMPAEKREKLLRHLQEEGTVG